MNRDHRTAHEESAEKFLAFLLFYHKQLFRSEPGISGVAAARYRVLMLLMEGEGMPMSLAANRLFISRSYMTSLVRTLQKDGFVKRVQDPDDGRVMKILITDSGRKEVNRLIVQFKAEIKRMLTRISHEELDILSRSSRNLVEVLHRASNPEGAIPERKRADQEEK